MSTWRCSIHCPSGEALTAEENGNPAWIRPEVDSWETWDEIENEDGTRSYFSFHGKYLSAQPDGTFIADRTESQEWERFTVEDQGNSCFIIRTCHGMALSADGGSCVATEGGDVFEIRYLHCTIAIRSCHDDNTLTAEESGNPRFIRPEIDSWERWEEHYNADGTRSYKSFHGKWLSAQPDGSIIADRDECQEWEKFTVESVGDRFSIKSCHGKYLSAQPDGTLECNRDECNEWECLGLEMA